jgi:Family of unknown function (DUF6062)
VDELDPSARPLSVVGFELLGALEESGCPVCSLVDRDVDRYLRGVSEEMVNDVDIRAALRRSGGFCSQHGHDWLALRDALGTAHIYYDVLSGVLERLQRARSTALARGQERAARRTRGHLRIPRALPWLLAAYTTHRSRYDAIEAAVSPSGPCPACVVARRAESDYVSGLAGALDSAAFLQAYRRHSMGLCLPHVRRLLPALPDAVLPIVLEIQEECLEATCNDLREVIRKNDYRYREEVRGDEFSALVRAVEQAAGRLSAQANPPQ